MSIRLIAAAAAGLALLAGPALADEPLTLSEAIHQGLAQSPELRQAEAELEKARIGLSSAEAERFTYSSDLNVTDRYGVMGLFGSQSPVAGNTPVANGMITARVPIFTGFKLSSQIAQADAGVRGSVARTEQTRQDLIWKITQAYWQAHRAGLRARIQQEAVDQARQSRDVVKASYSIGRASGNELDRVEVSLLNQESDLLRAQGEAQQARDQLAALLQRDLADVSLTAPPPAPELQLVRAAKPDDTAIKAALEQRPDVRAAKAALEAQQASVTAAQGDRYPQLDLISAYQHGNNPFIATSQNRSVLDTFVGTWDARLNMSFHLFDHGVIGRNIERAQADVRAAEQGLESVRRQASLEVRQALRSLELAQRRVELGTRSETLATANLKWLEGRFKFGYALPVELNEARVNLVTARNQRVDAQIDYQLALSQLEKAMGRLDAPTPDPAALKKQPQP